MRILGIDPGLNITGYGVVTARQNRVVEAGILKIKKQKMMAPRLDELFESVRDVINSLGPDCMAIEDLYSHYERPKTAIIMGHARGVILLAAQQCKIPVTTYAATQIKSVMTGNGRAPKSQMQAAVCRQLDIKQELDPPDVADALAIALCHDHFLKIENQLQESQ